MRDLIEKLIKEDELDDVLKPIDPEKYSELQKKKIERKLAEGGCTQNKDGTWDCKYDVPLHHMNLTKLPVKFGRVEKDFYCDYNELTTLKGSPKYVGGSFDCRSNKLTSLVGGPEVVAGNRMDCNDNQLDTLEGFPKLVRDILLQNNKLTTLEGIGKVVGAIYVAGNPVSIQDLLKTIGLNTTQTRLKSD